MGIYDLPLPQKVRDFASFLRQFWINARYLPFESPQLEFDRIYFAHIRKCGGTSINSAVMSSITGASGGVETLAQRKPPVINANGKTIVGWDRNLISRGAFFYGFSHKNIQALRLPVRTFTFTMLRDPVARVISYYRMLLDLQSKPKLTPLLRKEVTYLGRNFAEFIERVPRQHLEAQLYMFDNRYHPETAINRLIGLDFIGVVGRSEHLLSERLESLFGLRLQPLWLNASGPDFRPTDEEVSTLRSKIGAEEDFYDRALSWVSL